MSIVFFSVSPTLTQLRALLPSLNRFMAVSLVFTALRREPELVAPAKPTPHEFKLLSDVDDQQGLRRHANMILFFRSSPSMAGVDPARVVREGLAKALVYYYPLAGRLREGPGRKLVVECTGEGVLFVEADADIRLEQFGAEPPFPCIEELTYGCGGLLSSPLLSIQVTRLKCRGFIFASQLNHTIADGTGLAQFLMAVAEMARGAVSPTVRPVWAREMLMAQDPPRVTRHEHPEYDQYLLPDESSSGGDMIVRSFFFGPREMSIMRQHLPPHLHTSTDLEVLTACLWRSRTIALAMDPEEEVRMTFIVNARKKCIPPLPAGYYGNACAFVVTRSTAGELRRNPLAYAVELIRAAKASVTDGYLQSVANLMVLRGRPPYTMVRTYRVSDLTRLGFHAVDFGWGTPLYYGPAIGGDGDQVFGRDRGGRGRGYYTRYKNSKGDYGILVPVSVPASAMKIFIAEIERLTKEPAAMKEDPCSNSTISLPISPGVVINMEEKMGRNKILNRL